MLARQAERMMQSSGKRTHVMLLYVRGPLITRAPRHRSSDLTMVNVLAVDAGYFRKNGAPFG
jgi:hypothetical protein